MSQMIWSRYTCSNPPWMGLKIWNFPPLSPTLYSQVESKILEMNEWDQKKGNWDVYIRWSEVHAINKIKQSRTWWWLWRLRKHCKCYGSNEIRATQFLHHFKMQVDIINMYENAAEHNPKSTKMILAEKGITLDQATNEQMYKANKKCDTKYLTCLFLNNK